MSDFFETWDLIRKRYVNDIQGLNEAQLNWRMQPGSLTIGEMSFHVAGVEVSFLSQLMGHELDEFGAKVKAASTEGVVNDHPFPLDPSEITPESVGKALELGYHLVYPVITNLTGDVRSRSLKSALGPMIDGTGAFARIAYHPGYHQGQVYLIKTAEGFPA